jgi:hypothetical protein
VSRYHPLRRFAVAFALAIASGVLASVTAAPAQNAPPPRDFGRPPSGAISIIFNDEHVYAKPDVLRAGRVLAALVRNGVVMVPLRSMFEQLGATVAWDEATRTADVAKPGSDVKVTLGKPVVVVNGEDRPLDVPPMMYRGTVVVPVRVISEAMGAYVQWIPERRVVVVRVLYAAPPPPPTTPPATPTPSPAPRPTPLPVVTPSPTPSPSPARSDAFVAADYLFSPKVYDEISPGNTATGSYTLHGAVEFPLAGLPVMLEGDYRHYQYPHTAQQIIAPCAPGTPGVTGCGTVVGNQVYQTGNCPSTTDQGCVTVVGFQNIIKFNGLGQAYVPALTAQENEGDVRLGFKIFEPRVYVGVGYLTKTYNYLGVPRLSGVGFGATKLPDLAQALSLEGSAWYYPRISGNYTYPTTPLLGPLSNQTIPLSYSYWKYRAGATVRLGSALFFDFGLTGERATARTNAPSDTTVNAPYAGVGIHF